MTDRVNPIACVVGLGYVGLPLAEAFARTLHVIGFDIDTNKVKKLRSGNTNPNFFVTDDPKEIGRADFSIICVPTPVTPSKQPDLAPVISAAKIIGKNMKKGSIVVLESTVYPGVTEEVVAPILEKESGLKCGRDFKVGYSPERINPGDKEHVVERITKVVSGMDEETRERVAELYSRATPNIFRAKNIKTAEAAKVIENIQRDLNIALMNELSLIFARMGLNTREVLDAASTKWNFVRYSPGMVGGHCIPVDPYYLVYKAQELGYHAQVILAGRAINDYMPKHVAEMTIKALNDAGKVIRNSRVLVMGLTYKEDGPDIRETPVKEMIKELKEYRVETFGLDPVLETDDNLEKEFGVKLFHSFEEVRKLKFDGVIVAVAHTAFRALSLEDLKAIQNDNPVLIDVRSTFDADRARRIGFRYFAL